MILFRVTIVDCVRNGSRIYCRAQLAVIFLSFRGTSALERKRAQKKNALTRHIRHIYPHRGGFCKGWSCMCTRTPLVCIFQRAGENGKQNEENSLFQRVRNAGEGFFSRARERVHDVRILYFAETQWKGWKGDAWW